MAENEQQFAVQRLYVKDVSFEAPLGAEVFTKQWQPEIQVDLGSKNNKLSDDQYEVTLSVTITGKLDDSVAFLIEVHQAGIFLIKGLEDEQLRRAVSIMCPNLLFPYVREAVDNLAIKGGFPAIGLQPVNFEALYMQAMQKAAAEQQAQAEAPAAPEAH
ncbi:protein-export chaperone SecB [Dasania sp. GY-MA-18]|uniref:Protein-export protein SecB n=1 Tax=Dasania phycosphaerae TaxID=2950436 RepID=A0A9J6RN88_9GAMM|nr:MULTISPECIES: protein-export chaperone SecB [Dasania]MCR8923038.1 protein-export chaperone SecB [Dasania sp. GY-MA-18]MCZ0865469.1 protein-export chaperone SecB [Dasania phycosphaerae]MCZ0869194.1 protein-export chaperone SecB [Dasania phycosphaerae]